MDAHPNISICHVIGRLDIGGAERQFVSLLNALPVVNRTAVLVSPSGTAGSLEAQLDAGVARSFIRIRKRSFLCGIFRLAQLFRKVRPDVVHCHMFWASVYGALAARIAGVPVVVTSEHGENRWKRPWHRWLERRVVSHIAHVRLCVSQQILEARRDRDGVHAAKLKLMYNGTAIPPRLARGSGSGSGIPVIGTVGRFAKEKNLGLLLEALSRLRGKGLKVRCCMVGDGSERRSIANAVDKLGLTDVVDMPGMQVDVGQWLDRFDIFASSSSQEGQPVALLEAMAHGLPCIATNVGAVTQTMRPDIDGLVVDSGDVEGFAVGLERLLTDLSLRKRLGSQARKRVEEEFGIRAVAARHMRLYEELLSEHRRGG